METNEDVKVDLNMAKDTISLNIVDANFDFSSIKEDDKSLYITEKTYEDIKNYAEEQQLTFDEAFERVITFCLNNPPTKEEIISTN